MDGKEILADIREAIAELKAKGQQTVTVANLELYCDRAEKHLSKSLELIKIQNTNELEHYKAKNASELEHYKAKNAFQIEKIKTETALDVEMFKSVIAAGLDALKASVLINGGAVV